MPEDVVACTIQLIAESAEAEQAYAVRELWQKLVAAPLDTQPLLQVACWVCGEFANFLNTTQPGQLLILTLSDPVIQEIDHLKKCKSNLNVNKISRKFVFKF